jgi:membrane protein DedA with SNARE-associated domain
MSAIEAILRESPLAGLALIALLAWLEYVFPPSPGDTTILLGFFLAGLGLLDGAGVAAAALLGSVAGALTAYRVGGRLGRAYFFLRSAWARDELDRLERALARHGARLLAVNRFLPGVRGLFLYAAGMGRLGWRPVLVHSTLSNVLWIALIAWVGAGLGSSWEDVRAVFRRYVWGIGVLVAAYLVVSIVRRRRRARAAGAGPFTPSCGGGPPGA